MTHKVQKLSELKSHPHWDAVKQVCDKILSQGHQAFLAGGCVRDLILGRTPKDFDVATDASPEQIQSFFPKTVDVGKQFGVIMVPFKDFQIEVATFRMDQEYKDGRRPSGVQFSTAQEDALRRDFTMNALFMNPQNGEIIDYVEGVSDIDQKLIRAVGDPEQRFNEDKLRILRGIRFVAELDFDLEPKTFDAIVRFAPQILVVSKERIQVEFNRILTSPYYQKGLKLLLDTGILECLLKKYFSITQEHFIQLAHMAYPAQSSLTTSLAVFLKDLGERKQIQHFLKDFKYSKKQIQQVLKLLAGYEILKNYSQHSLGELVVTLLSTEGLLHFYNIIEGAQAYDFQNLVLQGRTELPEPLITGHDLLDLNMPQGEKFKEILQQAYYYQIETKTLTQKELLDWVKVQKDKI